MARNRVLLLAALSLAWPLAAARADQGGEGDPRILAAMHDANDRLRAEWMDLRAEWMDLRAEWMDVRVEQVEVLSVRQGQAGSRVHRQPFRWVAGDPRRSSGTSLSYLVDLSDAAPTGGVPATDVEAAIDRAMTTWAGDPCLHTTAVDKRADGGADPDLFDAGLGFGEIGDYKLADVVHAGWLPPAFFDAVAGAGAGRSIIALSVTFIFVGRDGTPTDIDADGNLDTAHSEVYYNDQFAWALSGGERVVDVESVALHEVGHSLGIGHLSPPPEAVMNPIYAGERREPQGIDHAAVCTVWGSWPN